MRRSSRPSSSRPTRRRRLTAAAPFSPPFRRRERSENHRKRTTSSDRAATRLATAQRRRARRRQTLPIKRPSSGRGRRPYSWQDGNVIHAHAARPSCTTSPHDALGSGPWRGLNVTGMLHHARRRRCLMTPVLSSRNVSLRPDLTSARERVVHDPISSPASACPCCPPRARLLPLPPDARAVFKRNRRATFSTLSRRSRTALSRRTVVPRGPPLTWRNRRDGTAARRRTPPPNGWVG